jgi:hypothetical protein
MNAYQHFLTSTLSSGLTEVVALVRAFPLQSMNRELRPGAWPVRRHMHHLRHIEGRYLERMEEVLAGSGRVPAKVQHAEPPDDEPLDSMLAAFVATREKALSIFHGLSEGHWAQVFTHPTIWGDVTIEWWAERFVQHTAEHLGELWMLKQLSGLRPEAYQRLTASGILTLPK